MRRRRGPGRHDGRGDTRAETARQPLPTRLARSSQWEAAWLIHLVLGGGPEEGTYDLTHTNPCQFNLPEDGDWRTTVTFPTATSGPSIIDLELPVEGTSYVDVYFGDDLYHAEEVEFTANDAGLTASLAANGDATGPDGGASFPVEIAIQCDYIARY